VIVNTAYYSGTGQAGSAWAAFTVEQGYSLTVHTDGTGSGTVYLDPPGGVYDYGTVVTPTATADAGSTFIGWSGVCSGTGDCRVTMTASQTVTATFDLTQYRVYLPLVSR